jgi:hypothetical protein
VTFACPAPAPVPQCVWWDGAARGGAGGWSTAGCSVASVNATSITCACDHLTEFAVRFAALEGATPDVFAAAGALGVPVPLTIGSPLLFAAGALLVVGALGAVMGAALDVGGRRRFALALARDGELTALAHLGALAAPTASRAVGVGIPLDAR